MLRAVGRRPSHWSGEVFLKCELHAFDVSALDLQSHPLSIRREAIVELGPFCEDRCSWLREGFSVHHAFAIASQDITQRDPVGRHLCARMKWQVVAAPVQIAGRETGLHHFCLETSPGELQMLDGSMAQGSFH